MRPNGRFFVPQKPKETLLSLQAVSLEDLGWDAFFQEAFQPYENDNLIPARVAARHHGPCELLTELGRLGVTGVFTDYPDRALATLGRRSAG